MNKKGNNVLKDLQIKHSQIKHSKDSEALWGYLKISRITFPLSIRKQAALECKSKVKSPNVLVLSILTHDCVDLT